MPPQKTEFIYYWLSAYFPFPLENICVRKNVLDECFPLYDKDKVDQLEPWLEFYYKFHTMGYLPYFIPIVASFFRFHKNQLGERKGIMKTEGGNYLKKIQLYKRKVISGMITPQYRNGAGELLPYKFSCSRFIVREVFSLAPLVNLARFSTRDFDFVRKKKSLLRIFKFIKRIYYKLFRVVYGCKGMNK